MALTKSSTPSAPATSLPVPEPDLTPSEVIRRAEAVRPALMERQAETEALTYYPQETHEEFLEAGFYRILQPRMFGGYEFDPAVFFKVVIELARGCPSTAWCYCLGSAHVIQVASIFPESTQAEVFGPDGEFRAAAFGPPMGKVVPTEGGYTVNGKWPYASGAPYSTHFAGHTLGPAGADGTPGPNLLFLLPRSEWKLGNDWGDVMGLKGSGSHSVVVEDGFLPASHVVPGDIMYGRSDESTPPVHANPMYAGRTAGLFSMELSAVAVGAAKGALDEYERIITTRKSTFKPDTLRADLADYQRWDGLAAGMIATGEAAILHAAEEYMELSRRSVEEGIEFTVEEDLRLAMIALEAGRLAWHAVEGFVFRTGSSSAARDGQRLQRYFRDLCTYWTHNGPSQNEFFAQNYGRARLGREPEFGEGTS